MSGDQWPKYGNSRFGRFRDEIARRIVIFAFNRIATKRYAARVEAAIRLGLPAAREEEKADAPKISIDWLRANAARSDREESREGLPRACVTNEEVEIAAAAYWPPNQETTHEWATIPEFMKRATRARMRRALEALPRR